MESNIQVIGNQSDVIYYNINNQFVNVKKVIITKNSVLSSFEDDKVRELIDKLKKTDQNSYQKVLDENRSSFDTNLSNELYTEVCEKLKNVSSQYMDVKLKDFNFMNTMSSCKFNVVLRCENFSITKHYIERGALISNMLSLIKSYLNFSGNSYRLNRLDNFQIELYSSEDIHKTIFLKKEGDVICLSAGLGYSKSHPVDHIAGCEFYVSKGNDFKFFPSKQTSMVLREHTKLVEKEIFVKEKILNNDELIKINEKTKNIDDALIECYINSKGQLNILNVSINENHIGKYSENGFVINKSNKNYDRISLVTLRDDLDEEKINPKYLLLKNESEIREFLNDLSVCSKVDGVLFTNNFYSQILDKIGKNQNIDFLFINKNIRKSLDEKLDWENVDIENSDVKSESENLFSSIMQESDKKKDKFLEKLKNVDLSTPEIKRENYNVSGVVNNIIGSNSSSFNNGMNNEDNNKMYGSSNGDKKSALSFLADAAKAQDIANKEKKEQQKLQEQNGGVQNTHAQQGMNTQQGMSSQNMNVNGYNNQGMNTQQGMSSQNMNVNGYNNQGMNTQQGIPSQNMNVNGYNNQGMNTQQGMSSQNMNGNGYNNEGMNIQNQGSQMSQQNHNVNNSNLQNSFVNNSGFSQPNNTVNSQESIMGQDLNNNNNSNLSILDQVSDSVIQLAVANSDDIEEVVSNVIVEDQKSDLSVYDDVLATELICEPGILSSAYFVDITTISQVTNGGKIYFLTLNPDEMQNSSINYVMPIGLSTEDICGCSFLIKNVQDFFLIRKDQDVDYFVNICEFPDEIKKNFIDDIIEKVGNVSVICMREDLDIFSDNINRINSIKVKDVYSDETFMQVQREILTIEKKFLMKKC